MTAGIKCVNCQAYAEEQDGIISIIHEPWCTNAAATMDNGSRGSMAWENESPMAQLVLEVLYHRERYVPGSDKSYCFKQSASMTKSLNALAENGWIIFQDAPSNPKEWYRAWFTDAGRRAMLAESNIQGSGSAR